MTDFFSEKYLVISKFLDKAKQNVDEFGWDTDENAKRFNQHVNDFKKQNNFINLLLLRGSKRRDTIKNPTMNYHSWFRNLSELDN